MKINPVAVQSYQQPVRQDQPSETAPNQQASVDQSVKISPQEATAGSRLAVHVPKGDYSELLTPEERQALELLFQRFNNPGRFGPAYQRGRATAGENPLVGNIIDVKV
ncbi:MAG: hypothetical protein AB1744_07725 [Candidatus Zixiibacteriota bacterium]